MSHFRWNRSDSVRVLLDADSDCESRDGDGNTPLLLSAKHHNFLAFQQLQVQRPMCFPSGRQLPEFAQSGIVEPGRINMAAANHLGQTVLHLMADEPKGVVPNLMEYMGRKGCQRPDANGLSPFHYWVTDPDRRDLCRLALNKYKTLMQQEVFLARPPRVGIRQFKRFVILFACRQALATLPSGWPCLTKVLRLRKC